MHKSLLQISLILKQKYKELKIKIIPINSNILKIYQPRVLSWDNAAGKLAHVWQRILRCGRCLYASSGDHSLCVEGVRSPWRRLLLIDLSSSSFDPDLRLK